MQRKLIYSVLALALGACAKPQPGPTTEEVVEQALPESTEIAESFTEVPSWSDVIAEGAVKDGWLKTFGDPELERIVDEALQKMLLVDNPMRLYWPEETS